MPGQGYHVGFSRLVAQKAGKDFTAEMAVGTLVLDSLNNLAGARRCSHFTGGAGCILPQYTELRQCGSSIQAWDSGFEKSFLVDPMIDFELLEAANKHISEGDYKDGIRLHLIADSCYDKLVQHHIFDVSKQSENLIKVRTTGTEMDGVTFRKALYASYPMLDNYLMKKAGITAAYIEDVKALLRATLSDSQAEFICKYLNFDSGYEWHDTEFFNKSIIDDLVNSGVRTAREYLKW